MDRLKLVPSMPTPPETDPGLDAALRYQFAALSVLAPEWGRELGKHRSVFPIEEQILFFDLAMELLRQLTPAQRGEFDDQGRSLDGKGLAELRTLFVTAIASRHSVMGLATKRLSEAYNRFAPSKDADEARYLAGWCFIQRLAALIQFAMQIDDKAAAKAQAERSRRRGFLKVVR